MSLFPIAEPPAPPPAEAIAKSLLMHANRTLSERVREHRTRFYEFWNSPVPPAEIAAAMGPMASAYLSAAAESVDHIRKLALIANHSLDDLLPPSSYMPRLPLVANEDGTVSVGEIPGLDDWGRPIVVQPEPEPDPAP